MSAHAPYHQRAGVRAESGLTCIRRQAGLVHAGRLALSETIAQAKAVRQGVRQRRLPRAVLQRRRGRRRRRRVWRAALQQRRVFYFMGGARLEGPGGE